MSRADPKGDRLASFILPWLPLGAAIEAGAALGFVLWAWPL